MARHVDQTLDQLDTIPRKKRAFPAGHYLMSEPYLGNLDKIKQVRGECGSLFEQYIVWLFKQFSRDTEIEIVHSFRIELPENQSKGPESPERDIALFAGARAFVFEVKSSIPTIAHRRRAEVDDLPFHPRKSGSPGCVAENFVAFAGDA